MFSFFRNRKKNNDLLQHWYIPLEGAYSRINNPDSVQFVNADESRVLYFSPLIVSGNQLLPTEAMAKMEVAISKTEDGWQLKGAKQAENHLLVCVFNFTNESDTVGMRTIFNSICAK